MSEFKIFKPVNGHPTKESMQEIVNVLKRALVYWPEFEFNICDTLVKGPEHPCGTSGCFAGAYAAVLFHEGDEVMRNTLKGTTTVWFKHGVYIMNKMLGLNIDDWACQNPDLWGNMYGSLLFSSDEAFREETDSDEGLPALTLSKVISWLEGVVTRLPV